MVEYVSVVHDGLGRMVGQSLGVFYFYDGVLVSQELEWIQGALNILIRMFRWIFLADNVTKSKTMTYQLEAIRSRISQEAFFRSSTGEGNTHWGSLRRCVPCPYCGVDMMAPSLASHFRHIHSTGTHIHWYRLPVIQN